MSCPHADEKLISLVIGAPIDNLSWETALGRLQSWASARESRYVCICNVHSVVTARRDPAFAQILSQADMATPDGAPLAWMMRRLGACGQARINGPDLMWRYCEHAAARGEAIYLLGASEDTLAKLCTRLAEHFPSLRIAGSWSPPYRALSPAEDEAIVARINGSGAGTVWVSLGCPKQEQWMAEHRGRIRAPMIGVGAAFDYHAGVVPRAPRWMRDHGLEWFHRLCQEPRRLWRRYLITNTLFLVYAGRQLIGIWGPPQRARHALVRVVRGGHRRGGRRKSRR